MQEVPKRHELTNCPPQRLYEFSRGYRALLQASSFSSPPGLPVLLQELSKLLRGVFDFNFISYSLADSESNVMHQYILDEDGSGLAEHPLELQTDSSAGGWVCANQLPLVLADLQAEERFTSTLTPFRDQGVRSLVLLPLTSQEERLGAIGFGKTRPARYDDQTVHFLMQIAGLVAMAVSHVLHQQGLAGEEEQLRALTAVSIQLSERSAQAYRALRDERSRLETVLEINAALAATRLDMKQMFPAISKSLSRALPHDTAVINLWSEDQKSYVVFAQGAGNTS